jgi:hypothetical protein
MNGKSNIIGRISLNSNIFYEFSLFNFFRKIEERKKLLEPQVLRIADNDDLLENDLEVDDSDEDNSYEKQSNYFQQGLFYY